MFRSPKLPERFWSKCSVDNNGCWVWQSTLECGYGRIWWGTRNERAHRITYITFKGLIPDGFELDHLCRNRACCNPNHLEPVTRKVNVIRGLVSQISRDRQLAKTHCPSGHEYNTKNTYITKSGKRQCRVCGREQARSRRAVK